MDPIVVEFEVKTSPEHAFAMWTEHCALWWPRSHSMSHAHGFDVVFEPYPGGRIYETGPKGEEHEWGEVQVWEPPRRLEYLWHIFLEPERATLVAVTFDAKDDATQVRLENSGFEAFGEGALERRDRVGTAWVDIAQLYAEGI